MINISLLSITPEQKKLVIEKLINSSSPTQSFFLVLIISALITTFGIIIDNIPIVIGGMLVSPLLSPILAISMGIVMADSKLILRSLRVLLLALIFVVVIGFVIGVFIVNKEINNEIVSRATPNLIYFAVALASGIAAAMSFSKEELSERIVGVAVAIALLPPLSVMGIGVAYFRWDILAGSLSLFLVNLAGILLGSLVLFSLFGFYPVKKVAEQELKAEEKQFEEVKKDSKGQV